jgi:hypothetical protein
MEHSLGAAPTPIKWNPYFGKEIHSGDEVIPFGRNS